ncbi:PACE efflux transporter [Tabrizicola sp.]|uniref:PACE efflux transporter n=1 Tax=Tabrizicola sp. TaxID=2005166 RepID=UPI0027341D47|nr:PACE efflux transporter [Tabrizicola sp.]MDP3197068.1 PACE efflux transporter [Tabrizicola sp.]
MTPTHRKIVYAVSFETLGTLVASAFLWTVSDASAGSSLALSILTATIALCWSVGFNTVFESWEARQAVRGRSLRRRTAHALLFEGGLVLICIPVMAWWLQVGYLQALVYEGGLIVVFLLYTYLFTWAFDRFFGLPASAR